MLYAGKYRTIIPHENISYHFLAFTIIKTDIQAYNNKLWNIRPAGGIFVHLFWARSQLIDTTITALISAGLFWFDLLQVSFKLNSEVATAFSYCIVIVSEITANGHISTQLTGPSVASVAYSLPPTFAKAIQFKFTFSSSHFTGKLNLQHSYCRGCSQNMSYTPNAWFYIVKMLETPFTLNLIFKLMVLYHIEISSPGSANHSYSRCTWQGCRNC